MATRAHGHTGLWAFGHMGIWTCGHMAIWDPLSGTNRDSLKQNLIQNPVYMSPNSGHMGIWAHGPMGIWDHGYMDTCIEGTWAQGIFYIKGQIDIPYYRRHNGEYRI